MDLEPIKERRAAFDALTYDDFADGGNGKAIANAFWENIEDDEAALIEEVERLRTEVATLTAWLAIREEEVATARDDLRNVIKRWKEGGNEDHPA